MVRVILLIKKWGVILLPTKCSRNNISIYENGVSLCYGWSNTSLSDSETTATTPFIQFMVKLRVTKNTMFLRIIRQYVIIIVTYQLHMTLSHYQHGVSKY